MRKLFVLSLLMILPIYSFAFPPICQKFTGEWQGNWEDEHHKIFTAQLFLQQKDNTHITGKFVLSDGSSGLLQGNCLMVNTHEAYLILQEEPPLFNPCRGSILQVDKNLMIHFYCFKPNQSGYFLPAPGSV